jgi:hypothetical protein
MSYEEVGYSFVYNQLYPFEGLQNYTSGIIHHVRLTGIIVICPKTSLVMFKFSMHLEA